MRSIAAAFILLGSVVFAQGQFSATAVANPVAVGSTITLNVEATSAASLATGCGLWAVHQDTPNGPIVFQPFICPAIFITVGPGAGFNVGWNTSGMPAGTYYIEIRGNDAVTFAPLPNAFFPVRVDAPGSTDPVLSSSGNLTQGSTTTFTISAPMDPGAFFLVAASSTTNTGFSVGATFVSLDMDAIFNLSFPLTDPTLFGNFSGVLDLAGQGTGITVNVPVAGLQGFPAAIQAGLLDTLGNLRTTNPLTFAVQ